MFSNNFLGWDEALAELGDAAKTKWQSASSYFGTHRGERVID